MYAPGPYFDVAISFCKPHSVRDGISRIGSCHVGNVNIGNNLPAVRFIFYSLMSWCKVTNDTRERALTQCHRNEHPTRIFLKVCQGSYWFGLGRFYVLSLN